MIGEFGADDSRPKIARHKGKIVIYAVADGEKHGFLLPLRTAYDTATRMLAAIADDAKDTAFSHDVDAITFQIAHLPDGEPEGMLTFTLNGAPVSAHLTATQVAELAAAFTAASRSIETKIVKPRRDR